MSVNIQNSDTMRASRRFLNRPIQVQTKSSETNEPFFAAEMPKAKSVARNGQASNRETTSEATSATTIVQTGTLSTVSWGETSGIYPTQDNKYDPLKWDAAKLAELLKARSAINEIGRAHV